MLLTSEPLDSFQKQLQVVYMGFEKPLRAGCSKTGVQIEAFELMARFRRICANLPEHTGPIELGRIVDAFQETTGRWCLARVVAIAIDKESVRVEFLHDQSYWVYGITSRLLAPAGVFSNSPISKKHHGARYASFGVHSPPLPIASAVPNTATGPNTPNTETDSQNWHGFEYCRIPFSWAIHHKLCVLCDCAKGKCEQSAQFVMTADELRSKPWTLEITLTRLQPLNII